MADGRTALMLLAQWKAGARARGFAHLAFGAPKPDSVPGLVFLKLLGSGAGGGFTLAPSFSHQGLFASFDSDRAADDFLASRYVDFYRDNADQFCAVRLTPYAVRGAWAGTTPLVAAAPAPSHGPIAALTRGSVRLQAAARFWTYAPRAQASLQHAPGCLLAAGLGEAPLLRQATFSVWENTSAMDAYARSGAHGDAIAATYRHGFFSESLFARFIPLRIEGAWNGFNTTAHALALNTDLAA